jgi:hypothetical protein
MKDSFEVQVEFNLYLILWHSYDHKQASHYITTNSHNFPSHFSCSYSPFWKRTPEQNLLSLKLLLQVKLNKEILFREFKSFVKS